MLHFIMFLIRQMTTKTSNEHEVINECLNTCFTLYNCEHIDVADKNWAWPYLYGLCVYNEKCKSLQ